MEESNNIIRREEKSSWSKLISFLLILAFCFFVGNVVLVVLAMMGGMRLEEGMDIFAAISNPEMKPFIKTGIGLNHFIIFTGTSIAFAYWLKNKKWLDYFSFDQKICLRFRNKFKGGFIADIQLMDVYGLSPEVIERVKQQFKRKVHIYTCPVV